MRFGIEEVYIHPKINVNTGKPSPSGLQPFIHHPFPYDVSTLHAWFQRIKMIPCGWQDSFSHFHAIAQITLSSVPIE